MAGPKLGELLVEAGIASDWQVNAALAWQRKFGGRLGELLLQNGYVDADALFRVLAQRLGVRFVRLGHKLIDGPVVRVIPAEVSVKHRALAIQFVPSPRRNVLVVATDDPTREDVLRLLRAHTRMDVQFVLVTPDDLDRGLAVNGLVAPRREIELPAG